MTKVVLHLGSNMDNKLKYIKKALFSIEKKVGKIFKTSNFYNTAAWGIPNQEPFLNIAILIETDHSPSKLLKILKIIEHKVGRKKREKWKQREVDIDIIFYGNEVINTESLTVPHKLLQDRNFVLVPLMDIVQYWIHPVFNQTVSELYQKCSDVSTVTLFKAPQKTNSIYNFIVIEGNIGAGKTSFCKKSFNTLDAKLITEDFEENPFLPLFYKNKERYAFSVELFFMTERQKQLSDELLQPKLFNKRILTDYIFTKTILFAKNNLNEVEFKLFKRVYIMMNKPFPQPDILIYLYRPAVALLQNIKKRGRDFEQYITAEYLNSIHNVYMKYFKTEKKFPIVIVNLGDKDFIENKKNYKKIINLLTKDFYDGVTVVNI